MLWAQCTEANAVGMHNNNIYWIITIKYFINIFMDLGGIPTIWSYYSLIMYLREEYDWTPT